MLTAMRKPLGGVRPGAGRPKGHTNGLAEAKMAVDKKTRLVSKKMQDEIATMEPKEIMLIAARLAAAEGDWESASIRAQRCASYYNRQLTHTIIDATVTHETKNMDDNDLTGMISLLEAEWQEVKS